MKSIYISLMGVAVFANHSNDQKELIIDSFYDGFADISTDKNNDKCQSVIGGHLDLLSADFKYCTKNDQHEYGTNINCVNKDDHKKEMEDLCGDYKEVKYGIKIHTNKNTYDNSRVSLTFSGTFTTSDYPYKTTITEEHVFNFNDNGLITRFEFHVVPQEPNEYGQQPQQVIPGYEPRIDTPPVPDYDDLMVREYKNLKVDVQVYDDVLYGGYMKVTNTVELEHVRDDILALGDRIRKELGVDFESITLSQDGAYYKDISDYRIRYRCLVSYVGPIPEAVQHEDGSVTQTGGGLSLGYIEYDVVLAQPNGYGQEPEKVNNYVEPQEPAQYGADYNQINEIKNELGRVWCKSHDDKMNDNSIKEKFCDNIEYELVCNGDSYDCNMFGKGTKKIKGREAFLNEFSQYENLLDDAIIDGDNNMIAIKYRKGKCEGDIAWEINIEYDSKNECISKWIDYNDYTVITDKDGLPDCDNSQLKLMEKLQNECTFDDAYDTSDYNDKEKENKISEMNNQLERVLCKKESDKMSDINMKERFCDNMEYEAVCNDDSSKDCQVFKNNVYGREEFVNYFGQWENLFDEVIIYNGDNNMLTIKYRKGQCQGEIKERVEIEYDSYNGCISKWTEYIKEIKITDKDGSTDCDNSAYKFMEKLQNECTFDDNQMYSLYTDNQPATGYGSGLGSMVKDYETNHYNPDEPTGYTSTGSDGTKRLVKKEREDKLKLFYEAAFECRLRRNAGNTQLLEKFMGYLCDSAKLCVVGDDGESESCYNKDKIREMMGDRYVDDNESISHKVDIISNDGDNIHSKCTSRRRKSNGCIVIKEEYDECAFNSDGSIKEFKVMRSNRRTECDDNGASYK